MYGSTVLPYVQYVLLHFIMGFFLGEGVCGVVAGWGVGRGWEYADSKGPD